MSLAMQGGMWCCEAMLLPLGHYITAAVIPVYHSCVEQYTVPIPSIQPIEASFTAAIAVNVTHSTAFKWYSVLTIFSESTPLSDHSPYKTQCDCPYSSFRTIQTLPVYAITLLIANRM